MARNNTLRLDGCLFLEANSNCVVPICALSQGRGFDVPASFGAFHSSGYSSSSGHGGSFPSRNVFLS